MRGSTRPPRHVAEIPSDQINSSPRSDMPLLKPPFLASRNGSAASSAGDRRAQFYIKAKCGLTTRSRAICKSDSRNQGEKTMLQERMGAGRTVQCLPKIGILAKNRRVGRYWRHYSISASHVDRLSSCVFSSILPAPSATDESAFSSTVTGRPVSAISR